MTDEGEKKDFVKPKLLANPFLQTWNGVRPGNNFSPNGMMLPREMQPPPMYGPRGATIPPRFLNNNQHHTQQNNQKIPHHQQNHNNRNKNSFEVNRNNKGGGRGGRIGQQSNRMPEKRDRSLFCETCDRDFGSVDKLEEHRREHQTCGIDGCKFIGHPMVVKKHIEMQHTTGLYDKIKKLCSPEEIAKWREERKKRYPSQRNVELRQKAQEEKTLRGERLNEPNNRFGDRRNSHHQNQRNNKRGGGGRGPRGGAHNNSRRNNRNFERYPQKPDENVNDPPPKELVVGAEVNHEAEGEEKEMEIEAIGNLFKFKGTTALEDFSTHSKKKDVSLTANPLSSLLGMYGSESESGEEDEEAMEIPTPVNESDSILTPVKESDSIPIIVQDEKKQIEEGEISSCEEADEIDATKEGGDDLSSCEEPEECAIEKTPEIELHHNEETTTMVNEAGTSKQSTENTSRKRTRKRQQGGKTLLPKKPRTTLLDYSKLRRHQQNTMLSKLLEPEIRHERNVLLQCVRFVVDNDFFGIGK